MIRQALQGLDLAPLAIASLIMFVTIFAGISLWALTRSRRDVRDWSRLPLEEDPRAVQSHRR
jgi:hypothetical protein